MPRGTDGGSIWQGTNDDCGFPRGKSAGGTRDDTGAVDVVPDGSHYDFAEWEEGAVYEVVGGGETYFLNTSRVALAGATKVKAESGRAGFNLASSYIHRL